MKVLVLGVTGMLGSMVFKKLIDDCRYDAWSSIRATGALEYFPAEVRRKIISNIDVLNQDALVSLFERLKPNVVINCVGLIKQISASRDPLQALPINSILPHRLSGLCKIANCRLIHISTDCVFSGNRGMYTEDDASDAYDLYGKSKFIGELHHDKSSITLRTSIIGRGLNNHFALVDWFLSQSSPVKGYRKSIFSGLPTVELARVILDFVIPFPELNGLYHVSADPIDKYSLLKLVAEVYGLNTEIIPDDEVCINRSLNSTKFRLATGYLSPSWPELIKAMYTNSIYSTIK